MSRADGARPAEAASPLVSRRLLVALAASLLLHGGLFVGLRLELRPLPELKPLDVTLVRTAQAPSPAAVPAPAPPAATKTPRPKAPDKAQAALEERTAPPPEPAPVPAPAEAPAEPVDPAPSAGAVESDAPPAPSAGNEASEQGDAPATDATPAGQPWPRAGRIAYAALMGEKQYPMGQATHQWEIDEDGRYRLSELVEPVAVAQIPWFRPGRKLRESTGRLTAAGLRPERFVEREEGRLGERTAELDWAAQELRTSAGHGALPANAQDVLSLLYQLGQPGAAAAGEMPVTAGGPLQSYRLEARGEDTVRLPFGERWRAQHVRAHYGGRGETLDVWLAVEHFGLPVLIRTLDAKGVVYYLVATDVKVALPPSESAADAR